VAARARVRRLSFAVDLVWIGAIITVVSGPWQSTISPVQFVALHWRP
jgi:hypothetical protein